MKQPLPRTIRKVVKDAATLLKSDATYPLTEKQETAATIVTLWVLAVHGCKQNPFKKIVDLPVIEAICMSVQEGPFEV